MGVNQNKFYHFKGSIKVKTNRRGRPRKRLKVLAADKGYDSKEKRVQLRQRGIKPQFRANASYLLIKTKKDFKMI